MLVICSLICSLVVYWSTWVEFLTTFTWGDIFQIWSWLAAVISWGLVDFQQSPQLYLAMLSLRIWNNKVLKSKMSWYVLDSVKLDSSKNSQKIQIWGKWGVFNLSNKVHKRRKYVSLFSKKKKNILYHIWNILFLVMSITFKLMVFQSLIRLTKPSQNLLVLQQMKH